MTTDPSPTQPVPPTPPVAAPGQTPSPWPAQAPAPGPAPVHIPPAVAAAAVRPVARGGTSAGAVAFVAAIVIAAAGLGFAGGRLTAPAAASARGANFGGGQGGNFGPGASGNPGRIGANGAGSGGLGLGFGASGGSLSIEGQVTAIADGTITIQTSGGQSVTLQVPAGVTYHAQASATASDVTVGSRVEASVSRPGFRPGASAAPGGGGGSGQGGTSGQGRSGTFQMTVSDITVLAQ